MRLVIGVARLTASCRTMLTGSAPSTPNANGEKEESGPDPGASEFALLLIVTSPIGREGGVVSIISEKLGLCAIVVNLECGGPNAVCPV